MMVAQRSNLAASLSKRCALATVLFLYAISFFLPVTDAGTPQAMYGFQAFFWAFISIIYLPMWLANPVFWVGWLFLSDGNTKTSLQCGATATLLAVSEVWFWDDRPEAGYFVWLGSMAALTIIAAFHSHNSSHRQAVTPASVDSSACLRTSAVASSERSGG